MTRIFGKYNYETMKKLISTEGVFDISKTDTRVESGFTYITLKIIE